MEKAIVNFDDSALKLEYDATGPSAIVYDFEGNIIAGGGGVNLDFDVCTITLKNTKQITVDYVYLPVLYSNAVVLSDSPPQQHIAGDTDIVLTLPYIYYEGNALIMFAFSASQALNTSEAENCTWNSLGSGTYFISPGTPGMSSITITLY